MLNVNCFDFFVCVNFYAILFFSLHLRHQFVAFIFLCTFKTLVCCFLINRLFNPLINIACHSRIIVVNCALLNFILLFTQILFPLELNVALLCHLMCTFIARTWGIIVLP